MEKQLSRQEREKIEIEKTILQHAEELFSIYGYESTTMDALSESCEYTKRTIYRYFISKEDLYFAVLLKGHEKLLAEIQKRVQVGETGNEKIKLAYGAFFDFYKDSSALFDLMVQIRALKSNKNLEDLPYYKRYSQCISHIYKEIIPLFDFAQKDQSIRTDVDASQLGFSTIFLINGFFHMLSLFGDSFIEFFSLDKDKFIDFTEKMLFEMLNGGNNDR